ncbi:WD and tetratricopeptide repeats protein 1 isoform X4 [Monomorium pharaonis]|uniref:WD and tetratricopeptide repeats protein 1 isoform X4 n=1 Tax=Monomorium pharaonis TaxID=307658 RepID=UPI00174736BD|nr:WD and tetratricopeptide repeats protein 1 isoform X4 [Monomorium pharaonis]
MFPSIQKKDYRVLELVRQREIQDSVTHTILQKLQVTENLILRLGLEKELNGHSGCVNCLEWNETGQVLASASDDKDIILWDPFRYEKKLVLHSGHRGNIFSVKVPPSPSIHDNSNGANISTYRAGKGDPNNNIPLGSVQYFIAGHLRSRDGARSITTTYLTFSDDGNELLVNMGGEQIYLFDINDSKSSKTFLDSSWKHPGSIEQVQKLMYYMKQNDTDDAGDFVDKNVKILPPHVEEIKRLANEGFEHQKYSLAINLYNKAISYCPTAAVLFANRAAAYMKRAWDGDIYAALRDCKTTLLLDPEHVKAHFRLVRCLFDLNRSIEADKMLTSFQQKFPEYASNSACRALKMDIKEAIDVGKDITQTRQTFLPLSEYEQEWRRNTIDYAMRFCGHCNTTTDIKEANFFGNNGQYIVAGSDDGSFFIWDRNTTNIVRVLRGDERIVNCLQPHPSMCLLATSGIDPVIRLWSPWPEDGSVNEREIQNLDDAASANQIRMNSDPFELMLMNMGYRFPVPQHEFSDEDNEDQHDQPITQALNCRPS